MAEEIQLNGVSAGASSCERQVVELISFLESPRDDVRLMCLQGLLEYVPGEQFRRNLLECRTDDPDVLAVYTGLAGKGSELLLDFVVRRVLRCTSNPRLAKTSLEFLIELTAELPLSDANALLRRVKVMSYLRELLDAPMRSICCPSGPSKLALDKDIVLPIMLLSNLTRTKEGQSFILASALHDCTDPSQQSTESKLWLTFLLRIFAAPVTKNSSLSSKTTDDCITFAGLALANLASDESGQQRISTVAQRSFLEILQQQLNDLLSLMPSITAAADSKVTDSLRAGEVLAVGVTHHKPKCRDDKVPRVIAISCLLKNICKNFSNDDVGILLPTILRFVSTPLNTEEGGIVEHLGLRREILQLLHNLAALTLNRDHVDLIVGCGSIWLEFEDDVHTGDELRRLLDSVVSDHHTWNKKAAV